MNDCVVIGGGIAGMAAATALAEACLSVALVERRPYLGGRASSMKDPATGEDLDNGQHIFMGCYEEMLGFLRRIGQEENVVFQKNMEVHFAAPGDARSRLRAAPLPGSLHLLGGLLGLGHLSWRDRLGALSLATSVKANGLDKMTVREFLNQKGQSQKIQKDFWDLLCIAALNEKSERASAALFAAVLRRAFLRDRSKSAIGLSTVGLSQLFQNGTQTFLSRAGGKTILGREIEKVETHENRIVSVSLSDGETLPARAFVLAVPPMNLKNLFPEGALSDSRTRESWRDFSCAPIVSVNLWFEEDSLEEDFIGLLDCETQWVFNKRRILARKAPGGYLSLVISGAHDWIHKSGDEILSQAKRDLGKCLPALSQKRIRHVRVLKEALATVSFGPGSAGDRPDVRTAFSNVFLAGDWTRSELPCTMESAASSGHRAAEAVLNSGG